MRATARRFAIAASATVALWLAGKAALPLPPVAHPRLIGRWWSQLAPAVAWFGALRGLLIAIGLAASGLSMASLLLAALIGAGRRGSRVAALGTDLLAGWGRVAGVRTVLRLILGIAGPGVALGACAATQATVGPPGSTPAETAVPPAPVIGPGTPAATTPLAPILQAPAGTAPGVWTPPVSPSPHSRGRPSASSPAPAAVAPTAPPTAADPPPTPAQPRSSTPPSRVASPPSQSPAPVAPPPGATGPRPGATSPPSATSPSPAATPSPGSWTVRPGDDFWTIAESVVGASPSPADTAGVARYWLRLIQANRARLADPSDPDLLFAGQVLVLPPP